jgi:hypothetical protein
MLRSVKRIALAGAAGACLLALHAPAKADIIPQLVSVTPVGSEFLWTYTATLTSEQFLSRTSGDPNRYFTIYDFAGFVPMSATSPANWVFSSANLGVTPGDVTITDDPLLPNLTWTYNGTGPGQLGPGPLNLGTFTARSIYGDETLVDYSAMGRKWHKKPSGGYYLDHGTPTSNKGNTIAPLASSVPEPCSLALLGLGAAPILARRRRARSQA